MPDVPTQAVRHAVAVRFLQASSVVVAERAIPEVPRRVVSVIDPAVRVIIVSPTHGSKGLVRVSEKSGVLILVGNVSDLIFCRVLLVEEVIFVYVKQFEKCLLLVRRNS